MDIGKIKNRLIQKGYVENNQDKLFIKLEDQIKELMQ